MPEDFERLIQMEARQATEAAQRAVDAEKKAAKARSRTPKRDTVVASREPSIVLPLVNPALIQSRFKTEEKFTLNHPLMQIKPHLILAPNRSEEGL